MEQNIEILKEKLHNLKRELSSEIENHNKTKESMRLWKNVVKKGNIILFRWSPEPGMPLLFVSENISSWGYTCTEFSSGCIVYKDIIDPDDREWVAKEVAEYVSLKTPFFIQQYRIIKKSGDIIFVENKTSIETDNEGNIICLQGIVSDITLIKKAEEEKEKLILGLRKVISEIKVLNGLIPVCSYCKKIRGEDGYWEHFETFFMEHSEIVFSHGICPDCMKKHFNKDI
jgi:PAS domain S-box-containing protein